MTFISRNLAAAGLLALSWVPHSFAWTLPAEGYATLTHYDLPSGYVASCGCVGPSTDYPTAAINSLAYGSTTSFGPACGLCARLTLLSTPLSPAPPEGDGLQFRDDDPKRPSVVVKVTDLCPPGGEWCNATEHGGNKLGSAVHFDLASPSKGVPARFFPGDHDYGAWNVTYKFVPCSDWAGYRDTKALGSVWDQETSACCPANVELPALAPPPPTSSSSPIQPPLPSPPPPATASATSNGTAAPTTTPSVDTSASAAMTNPSSSPSSSPSSAPLISSSPPPRRRSDEPTSHPTELIGVVDGGQVVIVTASHGQPPPPPNRAPPRPTVPSPDETPPSSNLTDGAHAYAYPPARRLPPRDASGGLAALFALQTRQCPSYSATVASQRLSGAVVAASASVPNTSSPLTKGRGPTGAGSATNGAPRTLDEPRFAALVMILAGQVAAVVLCSTLVLAGSETWL